MTADDTTPSEGQESIDTEPEWEEIAREFLQAEMELAADDVYTSFSEAKMPVRDGGELTRADVSEMLDAVQRAYRTIQYAARVATDVEDLPDWIHVLEGPERED